MNPGRWWPEHNSKQPYLEVRTRGVLAVQVLHLLQDNILNGVLLLVHGRCGSFLADSNDCIGLVEKEDGIDGFGLAGAWCAVKEAREAAAEAIFLHSGANFRITFRRKEMACAADGLGGDLRFYALKKRVTKSQVDLGHLLPLARQILDNECRDN